MHGNMIKHDDARKSSSNRQYNLIPISEPSTVDLAQWTKATVIYDSPHATNKTRTTLQREVVTVEYKNSIRGPKHKYHGKPFVAITNATHTRHARKSGVAPRI